MALNFAELSDVWGDCLKKQKRKNVVKQETTKNSMNNIIDTYLDDMYKTQNITNSNKNINKPRTVYMNANIENDPDYYDLNDYHQPIIPPKNLKLSTAKCVSNIDGVLDKGTENQMDINRYYSNQQMFDYDEHEPPYKYESRAEEEINGKTATEEEKEVEKNTDKENYYLTAEEYYNMKPLSLVNKNGRISSEHLYVELALYVFGGIILIFILEQILQVGIKLSQI